MRVLMLATLATFMSAAYGALPSSAPSPPSSSFLTSRSLAQAPANTVCEDTCLLTRFTEELVEGCNGECGFQSSIQRDTSRCGVDLEGKVMTVCGPKQDSRTSCPPSKADLVPLQLKSDGKRVAHMLPKEGTMRFVFHEGTDRKCGSLTVGATTCRKATPDDLEQSGCGFTPDVGELCVLERKLPDRCSCYCTYPGISTTSPCAQASECGLRTCTGDGTCSATDITDASEDCLGEATECREAEECRGGKCVADVKPETVGDPCGSGECMATCSEEGNCDALNGSPCTPQTDSTAQECEEHRCEGGQCVLQNKPQGAACSGSGANKDCATFQCDGNGECEAADDSGCPSDDSEECKAEEEECKNNSECCRGRECKKGQCKTCGDMSSACEADKQCCGRLKCRRTIGEKGQRKCWY